MNSFACSFFLQESLASKRAHIQTIVNCQALRLFMCMEQIERRTLPLMVLFLVLFHKGRVITWYNILYFHSHIFPSALPISSASYSKTPTILLRKASLLPFVEDEDVRQNTEPISLLLCPN